MQMHNDSTSFCVFQPMKLEKQTVIISISKAVIDKAAKNERK